MHEGKPAHLVYVITPVGRQNHMNMALNDGNSSITVINVSLRGASPVSFRGKTIASVLLAEGITEAYLQRNYSALYETMKRAMLSARGVFVELPIMTKSGLLSEPRSANGKFEGKPFDEEAFQDWMADERRDDENAVETKFGEGWTLNDFRRKYRDEQEV